MNYKVMQRPMFKLGGKAASQGTGITSGLDEKTNYSIGGGVIQGDSLGSREGFKKPRNEMSIEELINQQNQNYSSQMSGMNDMRDIVRLNALGQLVGNVLPNIERGGFKGITDFFKDPGTTQAALQGLTGLKKVDLQEKKLAGTGLDNYINQRIKLKGIQRGDEKFEQDQDQFDRLYKLKEEQVEIARDKATVLTATQIRVNSGNEAREILRNSGVTSSNELTDPLLKDKYEELKNIADGTMTSDQKRKLATTIATNILEKKATEQGLDPIKLLEKDLETAIQAVMAGLTGGNAMGGIPNRVERQMGSPMMGEQPMAQPQQMAAQQDIAMETQQNSGNKVYEMLRSRLPQEVPDEVVQLISYNKEAFADFASIKNQEDVSSFNDKYGVQLVIDVATV